MSPSNGLAESVPAKRGRSKMKYIVVCLATLAVLALEVCSNEVEVAGDDLPQTDQLK